MQKTRTEEVSFKRSITPFVIEHTIVDFCMGRLDLTTSKELEKKLLSDQLLKQRVIEIEEAIEFCNSLSEVRVTGESIQELSEDLGLQKIIAYYKKIRPQIILAVSLVASFVLSLLIYRLIKMYVD